MQFARKAALAAGVLTLTIYGLATVVAQEAGSAGASGSAGTSGKASGVAGHGKKDQALATCLLIDGSKQIQVSQIGAKRAQHQSVKAFAMAEVKEHQELKTKLENKGFKSLVGEVGSSQMPQSGAGSSQGTGTGTVVGTTGTTPATGTTGGAVVPGTTGTTPATGSTGKTGTTGTVPATGGTAAMGMGEGVKMLALKLELAEQCVQTSRKELESKEGADFDKAFTGMQLAAHLQLWDTVQVFKRHASEDLRPVLDEAQPVIEKHIAQLKQIMKQLESGSKGAGASDSD